MKKKSVQGCRVSYRWIDAIPEIFGEKWKKEGLKKGHEEGLEKGREEGMKANTINIVIEMKKEGLEVPFIAKITKIAEDNVVKILKDNGL